MMNRIIENNYSSSKPVVGMGATYLGHSDRHPYTVISVSKSGKTITVQADNAKRIDNNGMSESQTYEYTPNPEGAIRTCRLSKDGNWRMSGGDYRPVIMLGRREEYYDYSY